MADIPAVKVECAFGTDPLTRPTDGVDWTDITTTNAVESITVRRGLDMKLGTVETGTAQLSIDNTNGNLDPSYASSAYSPNVKPRKRIRVSVTPAGGTEAPIFTGFVERWPISWRGELGMVDVAATDIFGLLADETMPASVLEHVTLSKSPTAYWPLEESFGSVADDIVGSADGAFVLPVQSGAKVAPYVPNPAPVFLRSDAGRQFVQVRPFTEPASATGMSVVTWVHLPVPQDTRSVGTVWKQVSGEIPVNYTQAPGFLLGIAGSNESSAVVLSVDDDTNATIASFGERHLHDGKTHMVAATIDAVTNKLTVYVDGVAVPLHHDSNDPDATANYATMMAAVESAFIGHGIANNEDGVHVGHVAYWSGTVLSASDMADIYDAGTNAWSGDRTGARLRRVLDIIGVDAGDRDIDDGLEVCGPTVPNGENALGYIRSIAATENGALFVAPDGRVTFRQRTNNPTAAADFGDPAVGEVPFHELEPDYSIDRLVNYAEVQREGGYVQTFEDAASRNTYGTATASVQTLHLSPAGARSLATLLVLRSGEPRTTVTRLTVDGRDNDVPQAVSTGLDIGDAVSVRMFPPYAEGVLLDQDGDPVLDQNGDMIADGTGVATYYVERIEQRLTSRGAWDVSFGVTEVVTLPTFVWDTADQGWDESVWS